MTPPGTVGTPGIYIVAAANFPTELAAFRPYGGTYALSYAIQFYSSDWNASATYGQVAYWFIAMTQVPNGGANQLIVGAAVVANASVSTTPAVRLVTSFVVTGGLFTGLGGVPGNFLSVWGAQALNTGAIATPLMNPAVEIAQNNLSTAGSVDVIGASGNQIVSIGPGNIDTSGALVAGKVLTYNDTPWSSPTAIGIFPVVTLSGGGAITAGPNPGTARGTPDHMMKPVTRSERVK